MKYGHMQGDIVSPKTKMDVNTVLAAKKTDEQNPKISATAVATAASAVFCLYPSIQVDGLPIKYG